MSAVLERHRHSAAGFAMPVPAGWERTEDAPQCALVAVEPRRHDGHLRASVVVTVEERGADEAPDAWADRSLATLRASLNRLRVVDDEVVAVGGRRARRVLSHYVHRRFGGVNLEQWLVAAGPLGYVVSCSAPALEYDDLADLMHEVAEGLELEDGP
jgi:hypothetical protein